MCCCKIPIFQVYPIHCCVSIYGNTAYFRKKCLKLHLALSFYKGLLDFMFWNVLTVQHMLKHSSCTSGALLWAYPRPHRKPPQDKLCPKGGHLCSGEPALTKKRHRCSACVTTGCTALSPTKAQMAGEWERLDKHSWIPREWPQLWEYKVTAESKLTLKTVFCQKKGKVMACHCELKVHQYSI